MNTQEIRFRLTHTLTEHDRKQSKKRFYNPYALGQYLLRLDEIIADIERGADIRQAIVPGFDGRLCDACLRSLQLTLVTKDECTFGPMAYKSVTGAFQ